MILTYYTATTMIIIAYLLGSIPSAVWIGKKYYGIDIREYGSKNAGTTNMLRVLGRRAALPVFGLDFLKGFVAVTIIDLMKYDSVFADGANENWFYILRFIAVFAAVVGHIFPIFANFRGGKGVATLVGAIMGVNATARTRLVVVRSLVRSFVRTVPYLTYRTSSSSSYVVRRTVRRTSRRYVTYVLLLPYRTVPVYRTGTVTGPNRPSVSVRFSVLLNVSTTTYTVRLPYGYLTNP